MKLLLCLLVCWSAADGGSRTGPMPLPASPPTVFDEVIAAVSALAVSGNPHAAAMIAALQNEQLFVGTDGSLLHPATDDGYLDARTGAKAADVNEDGLEACA